MATRAGLAVFDFCQWLLVMLSSSVVLFVVAPIAEAQAQQSAADESATMHRLIVERFQGTAAGMVRSYVINALERLEVVEVLPIGQLEEQGLSFDGTEQSYVAAAKELELSIIVSGKITAKKQKRLHLELTIRNGRDGAILETLEFEDTWAKGLGKKVAAAIKARFLEIIAGAQAPPEEVEPSESSVDLEEPPAKAQAQESDSLETREQKASKPPVEPFEEKGKEQDDYRPPALQLRAGLLNAPRIYGYAGGISGALRRYQLLRGPMPFGALAWYPVAHFSRGFATNIGITGRYERLLSVESRVAGTTLATESYAYLAGVRVRIPFGRSEVGLATAYGHHRFAVADTYVPDVDYRFIRPSVDVDVKIWRLLVEAGFGTRVLLDAGEVISAQWFEHTLMPGFGYDAELALGFRVVRGLYVIGGVRWLRYSLKLNGIPEDMNPNGVAKEAIDYYLNGWGGLRLDI